MIVIRVKFPCYGLNDDKNDQQIKDEPENDPWIGEMLFRQYEVKERIGKGGFGKIYKCVAADGEEFAAKIVIYLYII